MKTDEKDSEEEENKDEWRATNLNKGFILPASNAQLLLILC